MIIIRQNSDGFTILELLIATTIFSVILLLCTFGLIQIGNKYYKGVTTVRTQNSARDIMENISQAIQYGSTPPFPVQANGSIAQVLGNAFCIGSTRYTYKTLQIVNDDIHAFVVDNNPGISGDCTPQDLDAPLTPSSKELVGKNLRLAYINIKFDSSTKDYTIDVIVQAGSHDLSDVNVCKAGPGSQFCAVAKLQTTVHRRLN